MFVVFLLGVVLLLAYILFPKMKLLWRRDIISAKLDLISEVSNLPENFTVQDTEKVVGVLMDWVQNSKELFLPKIVSYWVFRISSKDLNEKTKNEIDVLDNLLLHFWNGNEEEKLIIFNRIVSQIGVVYSLLNKLTEHFFPSTSDLLPKEQNSI